SRSISTPRTSMERLIRSRCSTCYASADQTPGSILNVRSNDNNYAPGEWSNFRNVDLSQKRPYIDNEGSFYRRAYHLRHLCNTAFRIKSGSLLLGVGTL